MNLLKRISAFFEKPEARLRELSDPLLDLAGSIDLIKSEIESNPDSALDLIVNFFQVTSWWHDRGLGDIITAYRAVNDGQYDTVIGLLMELDNQFAAAGRAPFGMNRTKRNEPVTPEQVFLGNTSGLFTHPVSYWKQQRDEPKGGWGFSGMEHLNPYDVVSKQARDFMMNHLDIMKQRAWALAASY